MSDISCPAICWVTEDTLRWHLLLFLWHSMPLDRRLWHTSLPAMM